MEYITLNNGVNCPAVGIGTYMLSPADAENSVREALRISASPAPPIKSISPRITTCGTSN